MSKKAEESLRIANIVSRYQDKMFEEFDDSDIPEDRIIDILADHLGEDSLVAGYEDWIEDSQG